MDDNVLECSPVGILNWPDALPGFIIKGKLDAEAEYAEILSNTLHGNERLVMRISHTAISFITLVCIVLSQSYDFCLLNSAAVLKRR